MATPALTNSATGSAYHFFHITDNLLNRDVAQKRTINFNDFYLQAGMKVFLRKYN